MNRRLAAVALAAATLTACNLDKQNAPKLAGPSELGQSINVIASTDRLVQDGVSQIVVVATVRHPNSEPWSGVSIKWTVVASNGSQVDPSVPFSTTDAKGQAAITVTAPAAPNQMPTTAVTLTITAVAVGNDAAVLAPGVDARPRSVTVELVPPGGTLLPNRVPVPSFTMSPVIANVAQTVTFDASLTRDEGEICDTRCTYVWSFGSAFLTQTGKVVQRSFLTPGPVSIALFVTDERGGTASTTQNLTVNGPAAPVAAFVVTPASPVHAVVATANASTSTVGAGATITNYDWDFGDGGSGSGRILNHTWAVAGTYLVTLRVTDDLNRTATTIVSVTVS